MSVLARGLGIVVLAYSANALFNHTAVGLALKSHEGAYVLGFFLPFGVVLPGVFLGWITTVGLAPARWLGVRLGWRDLWATAAALAAGALLATAPLAPVLREPGGMTAVLRLFALLLVASTAEVLVFLGVLGNAVQLAVGGRSRWRSGLIALVTSSLAFGFFHLTYPAPWNTIAKCLGLSVVWAGVSLVFLLSRSLVAAIAFNNVMAVVGFARGGIALSGTPAVGWLQAILAFVVFTLVFSKVLTVERPAGRSARRGVMSDARPVIACDLGALSEEEKTRRSAMAARVSARFQELRETPDGYAARLDGDPQLLQDALEWFLLERRCCPFLRLELRFEPSAGPVWLHFGGGPGVKEFLGAAGFLKASPG